MPKLIYKVLLCLAIVSITTALVAYFFSLPSPSSELMVGGLFALAISFLGFPQLKSFCYTVWILVAISLGMIYPTYFDSIGNFQFKSLIVPFVQITMLGMGAQMSFDDFKGIIKMPKGVLIGVFCHFTIMPLVGFTLAKAFNFPSEIAAGVILIGCVPSAMASNVMSYLSKANLALAVTIGATSTILSPFLTPVILSFLCGEYIEINIIGMMMDITNMIIIPIVAGFIFNLFYFSKDKTNKSKIVQMVAYALIIVGTNIVLFLSTDIQVGEFIKNIALSMLWFYFVPILLALLFKQSKKITISMITGGLGFIAMLGIIINTVIITAAGRDNLMTVGSLLIVSCLIHNVMGLSIGYTVAKLFGLPEKDRRTIAFEVGMQNGGVATGLALQMGKIATVGLASAIFGPLQNLTGSALVDIFKRYSVDEDEKNE